MQNEKVYGTVLITRTPREMIQAGWIVGPRGHIEYAPAIISEGELVIAAYRRHQQEVAYDAKLLVCCNGNQTINAIVEDACFKQETAKDNIKVFRISSAGGAWINDVDYTKNRTEFFKQLREHQSKAIILHINILTEGIDVPDFSGVMFLRNMELLRFMQSIGRAMRKHEEDKYKSVDNKDTWIKQYAWAVFVMREENTEDADRNANLRNNIQRMRDAGYLEGVDLRQEFVLGYDKGTPKPEDPPPTNPTVDEVSIRNFGKTNNFNDLFEQIVHDIESEDKAKLDLAEVAAKIHEFLDFDE